MGTFEVPSDASSSPPGSPDGPIGAYPRTQPKAPKRSERKTKRKGESATILLPRYPGFTKGERILRAAQKNPPTRWLAQKRNKLVAVKLVPATSSCDLATVQKLRRDLNYVGLIRMVTYWGFGSIQSGIPDPSKRHIAWEFCDEGTLGDLLYDYQDGVEEDFVWHTLLSLLKSALYLQTGERFHEAAPAQRRPAQWMPIVHNQIHPFNIFLMSPLVEGDHPRIKLGKFTKVSKLPSKEHRTTHADFPFPYQFADQHTGFEAPELVYLKPGPNDEADYYRPIGGRSDLWSIGAVAIAMMGSVSPYAEPWLAPEVIADCSSWELLQLRSIRTDTWHEDNLPMEYSSQLRRFLARLLVNVPSQRIDAKDAVLECYAWYREWLGELKEEVTDEVLHSPKS